MKRKIYCCGGSRDLYEEYYQRQNAGEIPVFVGCKFQHGHGLGSMLKGFFRHLVLPFSQSHGKEILANAVKTTAQVADDKLGGKTMKESAKHRIPTGIKRTLLGLGPQSVSGARIVKRRKRDIFFVRYGFYSRRLLRMYKVRIRPVFHSANSD